MPVSKSAPSDAGDMPAVAVVAPLARAWNAYREASAAKAAVRESIEALSELDDAALADIGVFRREIPVVAAKAVRVSQ